MSRKKNLSYDDAVKELELIIDEIEAGDLSVEKVNEKIKRASFLLEYCKKKLRSTQSDLNNLLNEMDNENENQKEKE